MDAKQYHSVTDPGKERELNEDSMGTVPLSDGVLLIVCDGMGGHEGGEVASKLAVEAISQIFVNSPSTDPGEKLMNGFRVANQRILSTAEKNGTEGMGTTAVAACVRGSKATIAHVGDSRCYLVRGGKLAWKTKDHTRVQKMIDRGIIAAEDAKHHPDANVVTRALGYRETSDGEPIEPDISDVDLEPGDQLLLASDGLFDLVADEEIAKEGGSPQQVGQKLLDLALDRGGFDNITISILQVPGGKAAGTGSVNRSKKDRVTDLDDAPVVARTKTPTGRVTDLDDDASADARRRRAGETEARTAPPDRRKLAAIGMFVVAAVLGIVVWLLMRGGNEPVRPKASPGSGAPGAAVPTDADTGAVDAATATGSSEAPPLPENPVGAPAGSGSGKKPPRGGRGSGAGSGSDGRAPVDPYAAGSGSTAGSGTAPHAGSAAGSGSAAPFPATNTGSLGGTPRTGSATPPAGSGSGSGAKPTPATTPAPTPAPAKPPTATPASTTPAAPGPNMGTAPK